jgi:hypothetical protein
VAAVRAADRNAPLPSSLAPPPGRLLDDQYHYPDGCSAHDGDTSARLCRLGDPSARRTMVVLGDSHAQMWMPDILSLAERDGWAVTPIGKSACLPHSWLARSNWGSAECKAWFRWAVRAVRRQHPDVVIVAGDYGSDWPSMEGDALGAVRAVMRTVPGGASHVVIVGDVPPGDRDPVDCVLASGATMRTCTTVVRPPGWPPYDHMRRLARDEGAGFLETRGWFCVANRCPTVIGQTIAFLDQSHITQTYARQLTEVFRAAFRRTIRAA